MRATKSYWCLRKHLLEIDCVLSLFWLNWLGWLCAETIEKVKRVRIALRICAVCLDFWWILRETSPKFVYVGLFFWLNLFSGHWSERIFCVEPVHYVISYRWILNSLFRYVWCESVRTKRIALCIVRLDFDKILILVLDLPFVDKCCGSFLSLRLLKFPLKLKYFLNRNITFKIYAFLIELFKLLLFDEFLLFSSDCFWI